ncbi:hypothetical protein CSIRO_0894 [Bradyrhizobiaceae bacterium SG-6C]|nr:hypothetical protein CSIRO_0894 [Bradyrhizobiaceae bacterium SG-6C]
MTCRLVMGQFGLQTGLRPLQLSIVRHHDKPVCTSSASLRGA